MLSYRHGFHAGNHADVLKHCVLALVIEYLKQKEKPFWYIDTHAGAGVYTLDSKEAKKNAEFTRGVERILTRRDDLPELFQPYFAAIDALRAMLPCGYPGSPLFAAHLLREQDRLRLFELHPQDYNALQESFSHDRRVLVAKSDGFVGLKALLPPLPRRALVLVDPPYELKEDYSHVVYALKDALQRFATGTYLLWYPLLPHAESKRLPLQLQMLKANALRIELQVEEPRGEFGMYGSGLYVLNPPWILREQMQVLLPTLTQLLGHSNGASFILEAIEH
jgi:23S rRNA (adenine2030-N6)-methyltransferase